MPRRLDLNREISKEDADDYVRASVGNMKFTRYSDGESLFLMTRNGRGYWRLQYRDGESFKAKMLGTVADGMTPNKARQDRDAFMVARRNARKGIVVGAGAPMAAAAAGAASAGIAPAVNRREVPTPIGTLSY